MNESTNAHLADLLQRAADTRGKVAQQVLAPDSPAHIDQQYAIQKTGGHKISDRLILGADVFTGVAADQLGALAKLLDGRDTIYSLFPLARSVIENSVGVLWILDPAATHEQRWARAALAEWDAVSRELDMLTHWLDKSDPGRVQQKSDRRELMKELESDFPLPDGIEPEDVPAQRNLGGKPYALAGEQIPLIENSVSLYLDDPGSTTWKGIYGYLCSHGTHASLSSAHFITSSTAGTGFTLPGPRIVWLVRVTLAAYGRALDHLVQWCGWDEAPVKVLIGEVALLDPMAGTDPS